MACWPSPTTQYIAIMGSCGTCRINSGVLGCRRRFVHVWGSLGQCCRAKFKLGKWVLQKKNPPKQFVRIDLWFAFQSEADSKDGNLMEPLEPGITNSRSGAPPLLGLERILVGWKLIRFFRVGRLEEPERCGWNASEVWMKCDMKKTGSNQIDFGRKKN